MLFAKISPQAQLITQATPFSSTTKNVEYMSAIARPYAIGAEVVNFEVLFGDMVFDENQNPISFQNVITSNVTLNSTQLSGWGVDDSYILTQISSLMDTSVVSYVTISEA
jgi:hypothetical protein